MSRYSKRILRNVKLKKDKNKFKNNTTMGTPVMNIAFKESKQTTKQEIKKPSVDIIKSSQRGIMNITREFLDKVEYICSKINVVEWSGILFYRHEGSIADPKTLVITPVEILLMDKGSAASTNFEITPEVLDIFDVKPELETAKMGMIHSHNSMGVFFSGTDMDELKDNVGNHLFYVSLVVNNKLEMVAKAVTLATVKTKISTSYFYNNFTELDSTLEEDEEKSGMLDVDLTIKILPSDTIDDWMKARVSKIIKDAEKKYVTPTYNYGRGGLAQTNYGAGFIRDRTYEKPYGHTSDNIFSDFFLSKFLVKLINVDAKMDVFPAHNVRAQIVSITKTLLENSKAKKISMQSVLDAYEKMIRNHLYLTIKTVMEESDVFKSQYATNKEGITFALLEESCKLIEYYVAFDKEEDETKRLLVRVLRSEVKKSVETSIEIMD